MTQETLLAISQNAALLLILVFIFDAVPRKQRNEYFLLWRIATGIIIGLITAVIMLTSWEYQPGVFIDCRAVIISLSALFFGGLVSLISTFIAIVYRLYAAGPAMLTGMFTIILAAVIGTIWRQYRISQIVSMSVKELYLFGLVVHLVVFSNFFLMSSNWIADLSSQAVLSMMLIYPLLTVLVGRLLSRRFELERAVEVQLQDDFIFHSQFDVGNMGIAIVRPDNSWIKVNPRLCKMLKYTEAELLARPWSSLAYADDAEVDSLKFKQMLLGKIDNYELDKRFVAKDGEVVYTHLTVACHRVDQQVEMIIAGIVDITLYKLTEKEVLANQERLSLVLESSNLGFWDWDVKADKIERNQWCAELLGCDLALLNQDAACWKNAINSEDYHLVTTTMERHLQGETESYNVEYRLTDSTGKEHWILDSGRVVSRDDNGLPLRVCGIHSDITEKKQAEQIIWQQANYDPLTRLPNRRMLLDYLASEVLRTDRSHRHFALMFLDLDFFKEINDTLGHDMGDLLLQQTAQRLRECVRDSDVVARLGGDEFTLVLAGFESPTSVERVAQAILDRLAQPYYLGEETTYISASIGITLYPDDGTDINCLLKQADQAMYAAKEQGRNCFHYFTPSMQEYASYRVNLIKDLRNGILANEFELYYQPIINLKDKHIDKAEALIRWNHPLRGVLSPAEFIPLAEETGLINDIGNWVFKTVAYQAADWRERFGLQIQISINKSPHQFRDEDATLNEWLSLLQRLALSSQAICVEITEGVIFDASQGIINKLLAYRDAGVQVSLDDFGTGHSSLAHLKKYDIDYLKIAPSFTRNLSTDRDSVLLCEAIIVMAHKLGIKVIAEGVETLAQQKILTQLGCDFAQGYFISAPQPLAEFELYYLTWTQDKKVDIAWLSSK